MKPIRPLTPLQRLAWFSSGQLLCTAGLGPFVAGQSYPASHQLVRVRWSEDKATAAGRRVTEFTGIESAIVLTAGSDHWFIESRLGRRTPVESITNNDRTISDLIEHFEIPDVPRIETTSCVPT